MIASFKIQGLFSYLTTRAKLRFLYKFSGAKSQTLDILGQRVTLNLLDMEQKYLAVDCVKEPENLIVYRALSESGIVNTFIDIGANCGHVAASIVNYYDSILLFEPNPVLAKLLRIIYRNYKNVDISECAIVDEVSIGSLELSVPIDSSGLASLGETHLSRQRENFERYCVRASSLAKEVAGYSVRNSYIKIDAEGFEAKIIGSAKHLIDVYKPIVGFEALSHEAAQACMSLFNNYVFYYARFDFLDKGGSLLRSVWGIAKALIFGASINIYKIENLMECELSNFSQIFSVPNSKEEEFEKSILDYKISNPVIRLNFLKTWSA